SSTGRLYRNHWDPVLKHGVYNDVSRPAGILIEGYGQAARIADINRHGWKDIYVTNDFWAAIYYTSITTTEPLPTNQKHILSIPPIVQWVRILSI
ncbi:MAG: hypothetical protein ACXVJD_13560, partial [Mucilaginibacter sp.]